MTRPYLSLSCLLLLCACSSPQPAPEQEPEPLQIALQDPRSLERVAESMAAGLSPQPPGWRVKVNQVIANVTVGGKAQQPSLAAHLGLKVEGLERGLEQQVLLDGEEGPIRITRARFLNVTAAHAYALASIKLDTKAPTLIEVRGDEVVSCTARDLSDPMFLRAARVVGWEEEGGSRSTSPAEATLLVVEGEGAWAGVGVSAQEPLRTHLLEETRSASTATGLQGLKGDRGGAWTATQAGGGYREFSMHGSQLGYAGGASRLAAESRKTALRVMRMDWGDPSLEFQLKLVESPHATPPLVWQDPDQAFWSKSRQLWKEQERATSAEERDAAFARWASFMTGVHSAHVNGEELTQLLGELVKRLEAH